MVDCYGINVGKNTSPMDGMDYIDPKQLGAPFFIAHILHIDLPNLGFAVNTRDAERNKWPTVF